MLWYVEIYVTSSDTGRDDFGIAWRVWDGIYMHESAAKRVCDNVRTGILPDDCEYKPEDDDEVTVEMRLMKINQEV